MTSSSHCDEWSRKDGVHQVNRCSVFCFLLSSAWPTAPLTTHYPSLSQRQICSFPHGPFCVTHHCDVVINQFVLTDLFMGEMVVMSSSCLAILPAWMLCSPGVSAALGVFHLSYQTFLLLVARVALSAHIEDMVSVSPGFLTFPCLMLRLPGEGGAHLNGREDKQQHKYGRSW